MDNRVTKLFLKLVPTCFAIAILCFHLLAFADPLSVSEMAKDPKNIAYYNYNVDYAKIRQNLCTPKPVKSAPLMSEATVCEGCEKNIFGNQNSQNDYFVKNSKAFQLKIKDQSEVEDEIKFYEYTRDSKKYSIERTVESLAYVKKESEEKRQELEIRTKENAAREKLLTALQNFIDSGTPIPKDSKKGIQDFLFITSASYSEKESGLVAKIDQLRYIIQTDLAKAKSKAADWINKTFDQELIQLSQEKIKVNRTVKLYQDAQELVDKTDDPKFHSEVKEKFSAIYPMLKRNHDLNMYYLKQLPLELKHLENDKNYHEKALARLTKLISRKTSPKEKLQIYEEMIPTDFFPRETCGMSNAQLRAIYDYTDNGFAAINSALREQEQNENKQAYVNTLNAALEHLNKFDGLVYRGVTLPYEALKQHTVGAIVTYPAYTSTSVEKAFNRNHIFVIKSKTGRFIAPFARYQSEGEVIFKPGTKFKVMSRENRYDSTAFVMEEVDP